MAIKNKITDYGRGVKSHSNFKEDELERIFNEIILGTSIANNNLNKIEVSDCSHSSKEAKCAQARIIKYEPSHKLSLQIILNGCSEWWTVSVYLTRKLQPKSARLHREFKKSIQAFNRKEFKKCDLGEDKKRPSAPIVPVSELKGDDGEKGGVAPKRKRRTKVSSVMTDEVVGKLLEKWMRIYGTAKIFQREFWKILSAVIGEGCISRQSVIQFLEAEGIIKISCVVDRKPMIELTRHGLDTLEARKSRHEAKKGEEEEVEFYSKVLDFPGQARPFLEKINMLREANARLSEVRSERGIAEKKLAEILDREGKISGEIEEVISSMSQKELDKLIALAKESAEKS